MKTWGTWVAADKEHLLLARHKRCTSIGGRVQSVFGPGAAMRRWMERQQELWALRYARSRGLVDPGPPRMFYAEVPTSWNGTSTPSWRMNGLWVNGRRVA